jgi:hypothetical protein
MPMIGGDMVGGMINRREFVGLTLGAGASMVLTPELLRAAQRTGGTLIQRSIPSSGVKVPVISFGPRPTDNDAIKAILRALLDNGGSVVDVLHGGPAGEQGARTAASELGIEDKLVWTTPLTIMPPFVPGAPAPKPDPVATKAALEDKLATFKVP